MKLRYDKPIRVYNKFFMSLLINIIRSKTLFLINIWSSLQIFMYKNIIIYNGLDLIISLNQKKKNNIYEKYFFIK